MSFSPLRDPSSSSASRFVLALQNRVAESIDGGDSVSKTSLIHRSILQGGFSLLKDNVSWHCPKWRIHVYVSGLKAQSRNEEFDELVYQFRVLGQRAGIEVSILDIETLVRSDNRNGMCIWNDYEYELDRCKNVPTGINFVTCASRDLNGPVVVPTTIEPCSAAVRSILAADDAWYIRDLNSLTECYRLRLDVATRAIATSDPKSRQLQSLRELIDSLDGQHINSSSAVQLNRNLEQSVARHALSSGLAIKRALWLTFDVPPLTPSKPKSSRRNKTTTSAEPASEIILPDNAVTAELLPETSPRTAEFLSWLDASIPPRQKRYVTDMASFKNELQDAILNGITVLGKIRENWYSDGCGIGLPGSLLTELISHLQHAQGLNDAFIAREGLVHSCMKRIIGDFELSSSDIGTPTNLVSLPHISLAIIGRAGSGKSSLIAKLVDLTFRTQAQTHRPVIVRFCGLSKSSALGHELVVGLCHQIHYITGLPYDSTLPRTSYSKLVRILHGLLLEHAIVLFLDGLDRLDNSNLSRSHLSFLANIPAVHPDTRIIVSCRADNEAAVSADSSVLGSSSCFVEDVFHGCADFIRASQAQVPIVDMPGLAVDISQPLSAMSSEPQGPIRTSVEKSGRRGVLDEVYVPPGEFLENVGSDAGELLRQYLSKHNRQLSSKQTELVLASTRVEPSILYLSIVGKLAMQWSDRDESVKATSTIRMIVNYILDEIEAEFDRPLVRSAVGMLAVAVEGLFDNEICDLLSLFPASAAWILEKHSRSRGSSSQSQRRLQSFDWVRLRKRLISILIEENWEGLLLFSQSTVKEFVLARYSAAELVELHAMLGRYFGDLVSKKLRVSVGALSQPMLLNESTYLSIWLPTAIVNRRRCVEASAHLIEASLWAEASAELCNLTNICGYFKCGEGQRLLKLLAEINHREVIAPSVPAIIRKRNDHYLRWIRKFWDFISVNPSLNLTITAYQQPLASLVRTDMNSLIDMFKETLSFDVLSWVRCRELGGVHDFDDISCVLPQESNSTALALSSDDRVLVAAFDDKAIRMYDALTGYLCQVFKGLDDIATSLCFDSESKRLASVSRDGTVRIWNIDTGILMKLLRPNTSDSSVGYCSVQLSADGMKIVCGVSDRTISIIDLTTGVELASCRGHDGAVTCALFVGTNASFVLSGSSDDTIRQWDAHDGREIRVFRGHTNVISSVACSGTKFCSGSRDKTVIVWDLLSGNKIATLRSHTNKVSAVAICEDIKSERLTIASSSDDGSIIVWGLSLSSSCAVDILREYQYPVTTMCMNLTGTKLATSSFAKTLAVWDIASERFDRTELSQYCQLQSTALIGTFVGVKQMVATGTSESNVLLWDCASGKLLRTLQGHRGPVYKIAALPEREILFSASNDGSVRKWNVGTDDSELILQLTVPIGTMAVNSDGSRLVVGSRDGSLELYDSATSPIQQMLTFAGISNAGAQCGSRFSSDGDLVVGGGHDSIVRVWRCSDGSLHTQFCGHTARIESVCFSNDGRWVISGSSDKTIRKWSMKTGQVDKICTGHTLAVVSIDINSIDTQIVSASIDKSVRIWDLATGLLLNALLGHTNRVHHVCFRDDGRAIVSCSADKTIRVWDSSSGQKSK